jgi:hypothetical protein
MGIRVTWGDEVHQVVHVVYEHEWTIEDYQVSSEAMVALMDSVDHRVDFIYEFRETTIPRDVLSQFPKMQASRHPNHPNHGFIVLVGLHGLPEMILDVYSKLFMSRERFARAGSIEEAYAILHARRAG